MNDKYQYSYLLFYFYFFNPHWVYVFEINLIRPRLLSISCLMGHLVTELVGLLVAWLVPTPVGT